MAVSPSVSIVIPSVHEDALVPVLEKCRPHAGEILILDSLSGGRTRSVAEELGAQVAPGDGLGRGAALRRALQDVRGDIVVILDADGAHDPGDIPKMVAPIVAGQADHCIASHVRGGSDEPLATMAQLVRRFGGQMATLAINLRFGCRLTDAQNAFRALLTSAARRLPLREDGPAIEQEITIQSIRHGLRLKEIPIHEYARPAGASALHVWRDTPRRVLSLARILGKTAMKTGAGALPLDQ